ncbi:transcriptional regulator, TetR family [Rhizobiales bacterium GAS191]|nr:transcriptional regulator, TetR family [Rhizobiales bacterium GAS191]
MINANSLSRPNSLPRTRGRPRAFDRDKALALAGETFWRLGYEGASIVDLTAAMGITPQSLYAAFTSKADLYREALAQYRATAGAFTGRALEEEPTAASAFDRVLREAAHEYTRPDQPRGCMLSTAVVTCAVENDFIAAHVAGLRADVLAAFRARIRRGIEEGDIKPGTDAAGLARYLQVVIQGMSLQARDGANEASLLAIAEIASAEVARHGAVPVSMVE